MVGVLTREVRWLYPTHQCTTPLSPTPFAPPTVFGFNTAHQKSETPYFLRSILARSGFPMS